MIRRVHFENWGPFDAFDWEFEPGGNFLLGDNYTGKTTVLLGICTALVGEIPFEGKQEVREYVRKGEDTASLQVDFELEGSAFSVRRNFSPKSLKGAFLYDASGAELATGWDEVTQKVSECLGVQSPYFFGISFMPEGYIYRFLEKPVKGILDEIDRVVGLETLHGLSKAVKQVQTFLQKATKQFREELKAAPQEIEADLETLQTDLEKAKKRRKEVRNASEELKERKNSFDAASKTKQATWKKIEDTQTKLGALTGGLDGRSYLEQTQQKMNEAKANVTAIQQNIDHTKERRSQAETHLKTDQEVLDLLEDETQAVCPVCKRTMDRAMVASLKAEVEERLKKTGTSLEKLEQTLNDLQLQKEAIQNEFAELQSTHNDVSQIMKTLKTLATEKKEAETQWQEANQAFEETGGESRFAALQQEEKELDKKISDLNRQLGALTAGHRAEAEIRRDLEAAQRREFLAQIFGDALKETVKSSRAEATEAIKDQAAELWKTILGRTEIVNVGWDAKHMVPYLEIEGEEFAIRQLSASEKLALFLAIRLALARRLGQVGFLILDEPYVQLDNGNRMHLTRQLQAIAQDFQIIATSFQREDAKLTGWPMKKLG